MFVYGIKRWAKIFPPPIFFPTLLASFVLSMKKILVFFAFFTALLFPAATSATAPTYSIAYHFSSDRIEVQNFQQLDFSLLTDYKELRASGKKGHYLFRISLNSPPPPDGHLLFIENEHLDSASLYERKGDSLILAAQTGNSFPESVNRFGLPQFRLKSPGNEYYILTKFGDDVSLNIRIDSFLNMNQWSMSVFFKLGLYYGFSLMFFILNLFLFVYLRDRLFLYYCIFQVFIVGSIAYADGLFPFIFDWPWLLNNAEVPIHIGLAFSGSLFALAFLEKNRQSLPTKISSVFLLTMSVSYLFGLYFSSYTLFLLGEGFLLLLLCFFWIIAAGQFKEHVHSRFFVLGYGVFLAFAIDYFLLRKLNIYVLDFYMGQLKTGSLIEMLVLSVAIVVRMTVLRDENLHYRESIEQYIQRIKELEVQEPTEFASIFDKMQLTYNLTDREIEVLRGISEGLTNNQIAEKVFLSVHTVKFHTRNIFEKLSISNRTQALGKLRELGG